MSFLAELFSLDDRVAVVTGGSSGIGEEMARALGRAGARVVLVARDKERLQAVAEGLRAEGAEAAWVSADLADRAEVSRAAEEAGAAFGSPDILVNCAGVNVRPPLGSLSVEDWDLTMAVNLTAPFLLGQRFGPLMAARGWGRIINVTSQQAQRAFSNSGGYGASKGGQASDWDRVSAARPPFDAPYPPLFANARWACCEVTLMIRPKPRAAIAGPNRWPSRNGAVKLTATVRSQSSTLSDASGGRRLTPAQLTRMSGGPNAAASAAARSTCERSARSAATQATSPPAAHMVSAATVSRTWSRATSTTRAPARASARAISWPIPELPPVTTATRPSSENSSSI